MILTFYPSLISDVRFGLLGRSFKLKKMIKNFDLNFLPFSHFYVRFGLLGRGRKERSKLATSWLCPRIILQWSLSFKSIFSSKIFSLKVYFSRTCLKESWVGAGYQGCNKLALSMYHPAVKFIFRVVFFQCVFLDKCSSHSCIFLKFILPKCIVHVLCIFSKNTKNVFFTGVFVKHIFVKSVF